MDAILLTLGFQPPCDLDLIVLGELFDLVGPDVGAGEHGAADAGIWRVLESIARFRAALVDEAALCVSEA